MEGEQHETNKKLVIVEETNQVNPEEDVNSETDVQNMGEIELKKRSCIDRWFSKMKHGSLRGSIFALSSLALGAGSFGLPNSIENMSILMGVIMLIYSSFAMYYSLVILIESSKEHPNQDYSKLVFLIFGKKWSVILDLFIMIYTIGVLIYMQVVTNEFLGSVFYSLFVDKSTYATYEIYQHLFWNKPFLRFPLMYGIAVVIFIPLCLLKDISKMRFASMLGILVLIYIIVVLIIESPFFIYHFFTTGGTASEINFWDVGKGFDQKMAFFTGTANMFYTLSCQVGCFPVYKTLKNNTTRRVKKVFRRSVLLNFFVLLLIIVCGYLSVPVNTPTLIISRKAYFSDYFMIIGRFGLALNLIFSFPANYNAFRISILELVCGDTEITSKRNFIVTIPVVICTCTVAAAYGKVRTYLSIMGGLFAVGFSFIFPCMLYVKTNPYPITNYRNILAILMFGSLTLIGFISGIATIINIIRFPSD